jgi:hypothetical protein
MGAWGAKAFDNDTANDWAARLTTTGFVHVLEAFARVEGVGAGRVNVRFACQALAACEVVARLVGRAGYTDSYTRKVDAWVAANPLSPPPDLVARAVAVVDRILGDDSALRTLWDASGDDWPQAMAELRTRLTGPAG